MLNLLKFFMTRNLPIKITERICKYLITSIEEKWDEDGCTFTVQFMDYSKYYKDTHVRIK